MIIYMGNALAELGVVSDWTGDSCSTPDDVACAASTQRRDANWGTT